MRRKMNVTFADMSADGFTNPAMIKAAIALTLRLYSKPVVVRSIMLVNDEILYTWYTGKKKGHLTVLPIAQMEILRCFGAI